MTATDSPHQPAIPIGVLISGRGSNLQALVAAERSGRLSPGHIALVVSNRAAAPGLAWADEQGLNTLALSVKNFADRNAFDAALQGTFLAAGCRWIVLAGYDRILSTGFLDAFPGRVLNIHPSLLPAYGGKGMVGLKVHQAVIAAGEKESGCTVHGVTAKVDGGPILGQARVPVLANDTPEALAARVLEQEHQLYPQTLQTVLEKTPDGFRTMPHDLAQEVYS